MTDWPVLFAVTRRRGPEWDWDQPIEGQRDWPAHRDLMNALIESGFIVLGGAIVDTAEVLFAINAPDEATIHETLDRDPLDAKPAGDGGSPPLGDQAGRER